jgi:two-component system, NtrC family, sensor histidine kinase HydH
MGLLLYIRLIGFTAGTLLQLFWMVVILGYRRQRNFERVFFFLSLALFLFYAGSLLALNSQIYYAEPPALLRAFAVTVLCAGLCFLPPLLIHLHLEYAETREMLKRRALKRLVLLAAYAPAVFFGLKVAPILAATNGFDFLIPGNSLGQGYGIWLVVSLVFSAGWETRFVWRAPDRPQRMFHSLLASLFVVGAAMVVYLHVLGGPLSENFSAGISTALALLAIIPSAILIYLVQRFNFLQIGRQKNLVYAISATFLALLYLSLVRRVSVWLEPVLPPEASASILLFVLVVFFEPIQRLLGRRLQETAHREMDRVQRLTAEIQQEARQGDLKGLVDFVQRRTSEQFELAGATLTLLEPGKAAARLGISRRSEQPASTDVGGQLFPIRQGLGTVAVLRADPHGAAISGETRAALEFLCEQLPGALELCRLIEEKLQLERELAERERLALVGQMAASISHNLKNPLGSIKTILQVQLENPELPESMRRETKMVLEEIGRLSNKLNQLLQFSRPAVRAGSAAASCNARAIVEEVAGVLRHEAERRGVTLETRLEAAGVNVAASAEAVNDIVSNLLVNALEATPRGGRVVLSIAARDGSGILVVEDNGPGIPAAEREKILRPFFTTKPQGTGLGLAIVARRAAECGGRLDWESPVQEGHGARFCVTLPGKKEESREGNL